MSFVSFRTSYYCTFEASKDLGMVLGVKQLSRHFDKLSSLEALNGFKIELDLVQKIIKDYTNLINAGKTI